ncbi:MAG: apolipoprotein N-acyltransferase [Actinomycetes bacterium]
MKNRSISVALSIVAGSALSFAFAPWYLWWIAPLGLALIFAVARREAVRAYQYVFLSTLTLEVIHLHWTSVYVGSAPWLVLALGEAIFFTLPFLLWRSGSRWGFLTSWIAGEWLIARAPYGGFGWSRIGYIGNGPTLNLAFWGGPTLIVIANVLLAFLLYQIFLVFSRGERLRGVSTSLLIALSLLLLPLVPMANAENVAGITLSGVQGNVPRLGLDFNAQREAVLRNHVRLTLDSPSLAQSDLVVWPENASDVDPLTQPAKKLIEETAHRLGIPILLGGVSRSAGSGLRNISLWVDPTTGIENSSIYTKRHLAPFGEYLPLRGIAELMTPAAKRIEDMSPGAAEVRYRVSGATLAPVICFEVLDDPLLKEKSAGAGVLVIQTNSATFGTTPESLQQLAISRMRSIEHGRPILSISTSGVSAFITSDGRITHQTDIFAPAVITQEIFPELTQSPSDAIPGGSANTLTGGVVLAGLLVGTVRRKRASGLGY